MKNFFLSLLVLFSFQILAQNSNKKSQGQTNLKGEIFGQIVDSISGNGMEYAAVSLYNSNTQKLTTGAMTNLNGKFTLPDVEVGQYYLVISFVGYVPKTVRNISLKPDELGMHLPLIKLTSDNTLDEIVLDGSTPTIKYEIDKKIVDVSKLEVDLGQSAVQILENTPSIVVDNDGTVNLRGSSSFTLLINGRPTAMEPSDALATIPASSIKNIEIITNPSAKYEAEGVSGIINIITKTNALQGISLLTNLTAGSYNNYAGDVNVNFRKDKVELTVGLDYRNRTRPYQNLNERTTYYDTATSFIKSNGASDWQNNNYGFNGDFVYTPNSGHVFSIGTRMNNRRMNSFNDLLFQEFVDDVNVNSYRNVGDFKYNIMSSSSYLNYKWNIGRNPNHYLEVKGIYNHRAGNDVGYTDYLDQDYVKYGGFKNTEVGPSNMLRFNADYAKKLKNGITFEAGGQFQFGKSNDKNENLSYNPVTGQYQLQELYSSHAFYTRNIYGLYALAKGKKKKLGYQLGLRTEYTDRTISSKNGTQNTDIKRLDWFPTAHFSYELPKNQQILLNYTRRIQRPRSYYLEPFITFNNVYSIYSGNPDLLPEYVSAVEISWIKTLPNKGFFSVETYFRHVENYISRVQIPTDSNVVLTQPFNVGQTVSIGMEPSFSYKLTKWWKVDIAANFYQYNIYGTSDFLTNSSFFNWNSRLTQTFPLEKNWNLQLSTRYIGESNDIQGNREGYFTANASIRKSLKNNKYAFVLQVQDIFSSIKNESYTFAGNVESYNLSEPQTPTIMLTFSMRLNNYKKVVQDDGEGLDDF